MKNLIYQGANQRKALYDLEIPSNFNQHILVFAHGFMGFKDWGAWHLVQDFFTSKGFGFLKYNISHNGTDLQNPTEFVDIEAFGKNCYSYELADLKAITQLLKDTYPNAKYSLIGHSRSGGIALLSSPWHFFDHIISWAGISTILDRFPTGEQITQWKKDGVRYIKNGRTHQDMPLNYSQYEDAILHQKELDIQSICKKSSTPTLLIHGSNDDAVPLSEGKNLALWLGVDLIELDGANHTFGATHPWDSDKLPKDLAKACEYTLTYIS